MTIMNRFALGALLAGLVLVASACDEGLTEANENPNAPAEGGPQFLFPNAIRTAVENTYGGGMLSHTLIWPQQGVQIQYPEEEQGRVRTQNMLGFWDNYYQGSLKDIQTVIDAAREDGTPNIEAVGTIWKAWVFHLVTDLYGDVPYSEALQADSGVVAPAYDPQQEIYAALLQSLEDAVAMLDAAGEDFGTGDILYGNNFEGWTRFANSLRMRLAMRLSEVDPATAEAEFVKAFNAGGFESNDDNAMLEWPGLPYANPVFENWQGRDDHGVSATIVDTLKSLSDPRLELYAEPSAEDQQYRGLQNGVANPPLSIAWYSRIGNFWREDGETTPTALLTWSEVLFLEAEAAERGWIAGNPAELYEAGIRANMNQYDPWSPANAPTDAEIDAYVAQPRVAYDAAKGREQIQFQNWLGLFMNGPEAWASWRRTDVPSLESGPDLGLSRIPVRYAYPNLEQSLNAQSVQEAVDRQGGGFDLVTPVWWDVR